MDVLVFHRLRPDYFKDTVTRALVEVGLNPVQSCDLNNENFPKTIASSVSAMVAIIDGLSEASETRVKKLAKELNKDFICLPRKHADWSNRVKPFIAKEEEMAMPLSVTDRDLRAFLNDFMSFAEKGQTLTDMVPNLKKYWSHGTLNDADQLRGYVHRLRGSNRCPEYFAKWWQRNDPKLTLKGPVLLTGVSEEVSPLTRLNGGYHPTIGDAVGLLKKKEAPKPEPPAPTPQSVTTSSTDLELEELLKASDEENADLRRRIAALEKELKDTKRDKKNVDEQCRAYADAVTVHQQRVAALEDLLKAKEAEIRAAKQNAPKNQNNLRQLIESFRVPWKMGAMDAQAILGILMDFKPADD